MLVPDVVWHATTGRGIRADAPDDVSGILGPKRDVSSALVEVAGLRDCIAASVAFVRSMYSVAC